MAQLLITKIFIARLSIFISITRNLNTIILLYSTDMLLMEKTELENRIRELEKQNVSLKIGKSNVIKPSLSHQVDVPIAQDHISACVEGDRLSCHIHET